MSTFQPRTDRVVIYQGDDLAHLTKLDEAIANAELRVRIAEKRVKDAATNGPPRLMHEAPPGVEARDAAKEQYEDALTARDQFAAEAETRGAVIVLRAVHRKRWRKLMEENQPRRDDAGNFVPGDEFGGGVNISTLPDALLVPWMDKNASGADEKAGAIVTEECEGVEGDIIDFLDRLSDVDYYDRVFLAAWNLNRGGVSADPTLRLGSLLSQTSDATSS